MKTIKIPSEILRQARRPIYLNGEEVGASYSGAVIRTYLTGCEDDMINLFSREQTRSRFKSIITRFRAFFKDEG